MPEFEDDYSFDTLAVRAGQKRTAEGEHSEPVFTTSSYVFASAAEAAARFSGDQPGNIYSRFTNPTVRTFEQRLAALEGAASLYLLHPVMYLLQLQRQQLVFPVTSREIFTRGLPIQPSERLKNGLRHWKVLSPVWLRLLECRLFCRPVLDCSRPAIILFHRAVFLVLQPCCSPITWQNWV